MHKSSMDLMRKSLGVVGIPVNVLDVGSQDVNGTYRGLFGSGVKYVGMDMWAGRNVDLVMDDPYVFPVGDREFELVISGQAFEHIEFFWLTFLEMCRVCSGHIIVIAPSNGIVHRYPVDCWRFYPDSWKALERYARRMGYEVELLESGIHTGKEFNDSYGIYRRK